MTQVTQTFLTGAQTMTLAAIAATAATPRPSGETQNGHALRIVRGIGTQLNDPSIDTGGVWRMVWLGLSPDNANMAYIAQTVDGSNQFAVVVRGTVDSPIDTMEDLDVGTVVPFTATGSPVPLAVSAGAMAAFTQIVNARGITGTPAEQALEGEFGRPALALPSGSTLTAALADLLAVAPSTPQPVVYVTGHSLGGCIASMLAPYLQAQAWAPSNPQFGLVTFAAPTAGLQSFAQYVLNGPWRPFATYTNAYDVVPRAWSDLDTAKSWYPADKGPVANADVKILLTELNMLRKNNVYVQPDAGPSPLNQDYAKYDLQLVEETMADYLGQVAYQHANSTYLTLLGGTPVPAGPVVAAVNPTAGRGGTPVIIHGTGFTPDSVIDFGTIPCTEFTVAPSGTVITATAPVGLGIVDVRVTTELGTSHSVPLGRFAYDGPAPVVVSAVTPSRGKFGDEVTITGSGFAKGATVRFRDTAASTVTVNSATEITATVPIRLPVPKTVDVTVTVGVATSPTGPPNEFTYGG
ncbi:IPT/TIG domain-containing protein [Streptomyces sp. NBC_01142]|uniref:IPT/TIG domain-containing protein n=1 Tax=Streptomyces sp. NBC_01142 TaxID=2975865 RepID=UPI002254EAAC|nr:IPT/TIG domain-containing protein [Streptomyces sp. NBC_01142]MCX4825838.1 IPT/TIG domain-containing protein [Streptomyces sp. NBC_01142]